MCKIKAYVYDGMKVNNTEYVWVNHYEIDIRQQNDLMFSNGEE